MRPEAAHEGDTGAGFPASVAAESPGDEDREDGLDDLLREYTGDVARPGDLPPLEVSDDLRTLTQELIHEAEHPRADWRFRAMLLLSGLMAIGLGLLAQRVDRLETELKAAQSTVAELRAKKPDPTPPPVEQVEAPEPAPAAGVIEQQPLGVPAPSDGFVTDLKAGTGDRVDADQLVIVLTEVKSFEAIQKAREEYLKLKNAAKKIDAEQDPEGAEAAHETAKEARKALVEARGAAKRIQIHAPKAGTVAGMDLEFGKRVESGQTLFTVQPDSP